MLTALVVHKSGDYQPGPGFFELARQLGHSVKEIEKFWIQGQQICAKGDPWVC